MSDQLHRVGLNEALFREVNERINGLQHDLGVAHTIEIVCECGTAACTERFTIEQDDYRALRANPRRFALVPGHEMPDAERIVADHGNYVVVEKTDPEAIEAAEETAGP